MAVLMLCVAWISRSEAPVAVGLLFSAGMFVVCALMFTTLTVRDEGQRLAMRFGPLPLLWKTVRYSDITAVEPGRSAVIDGWGIHWIPGRGTTCNLWGFGCAKLTLGRKTLRVGSDDVDNLVAFLQQKIDER